MRIICASQLDLLKLSDRHFFTVNELAISVVSIYSFAYLLFVDSFIEFNFLSIRLSVLHLNEWFVSTVIGCCHGVGNYDKYHYRGRPSISGCDLLFVSVKMVKIICSELNCWTECQLLCQLLYPPWINLTIVGICYEQSLLSLLLVPPQHRLCPHLHQRLPTAWIQVSWSKNLRKLNRLKKRYERPVYFL